MAGTVIARLVTALLDRIWAADERHAAERGWTTTRSTSGLSIRVRDPRWASRHTCDGCSATGVEPITGSTCHLCAGTGVVTDVLEGWGPR